jgi:murein DD-endopeptidase MepM/ murein hydrolase activator NlpD
VKSSILLMILVAALPAASPALSGGPEVREFRFEKSQPSLTDAQRAEIIREVREFRRSLGSDRTAAPAAPQAAPFVWPLRPAGHLTDPGYHGISGFVDHNPAYPDQLTDYNCGTRSYDLDSGYNHAGTDFFLWPHYWNKMDNDDVEIVAAAAGTIVRKQSNYYDRNCGFGSNDWNGVIIMHDDNSFAAYIHMKSGTVTSKYVHDRVEAGEYLGIVGSSGSSTGPHLHLEVWDVNDNLIDPWGGPCNTLNSTSWWADQRPYYDPAINQISTHSAPIGWAAECPNPDTLHASNGFNPGADIYFYAFGRDAVFGDVFGMAVFRPDNSLFFSDTFSFDLAPHWPAIALGWGEVIPASGPTGRWRYEFYYKGETYQHFFDVAHSTAVAFAHTSAAARGDAIEVHWEVEADEPIAGFEVYRGEQGSPGEISVTTGRLLPPDARRFLDTGVRRGVTYRYAVRAIKSDGSSVRSLDVTATLPAVATTLSPNAPNPFNPSTTIEYTLAEPSPVRVTVFDARGALVAVLVDEPRAQGRHTARWDGRAADGSSAASGVYFFRLEAGKQTLTRKMVLLK